MWRADGRGLCDAAGQYDHHRRTDHHRRPRAVRVLLHHHHDQHHDDDRRLRRGVQVGLGPRGGRIVGQAIRYLRR